MAIAGSKRKYCHHCDQQVALSTFKYHKRLYYNEENNQWIPSTVVSQEPPQMEDQDDSPPSSPVVNLSDVCTGDGDSPPPSLTDLMSCNFEQVLDESDSEPDIEVWEEGEDELLCDTEPPDPIDTSTSFDNVSSSSRALANWILRFFMLMQAAFRLPDIVIGYFLQFFVVLFRIIGKHCKVGNDIAECLPQSVYKAKQVLGQVKFQCYVVCRKCLSIYPFAQCIENSGTHRKSKHCSFQRYPFHPHLRMRSPCGTLLLKSVELASRKTYLYPFLMYCYLGLDVSLQSMFDRPNFFNDCEKWRSRSVISGKLQDVYDGQMWQKFICYEDKPFLSEPGNLGLILNFDFFQPYEHLSYSLGAIYMSVLNLPRESRFKQENTILVGLIPGPHEPSHDINSFLKPLVDDLIKFWNGVEMRIASISCTRKIHCALMCVSCDLPAGRKLCGFLGHSARLGCSRCYKEFSGGVGTMDYSGFDRENWRVRTKAEHNTAALSIKNLVTATAIEDAESKAGCRYSELLRLPYFDAPKMLTIDPMHNLFLGSAKYFFKNILISLDYIVGAQLDVIQDRVNSFTVPSGIGRIPMKISSGFSQFTADQWKNWVLYFSVIAMRDIITDEVLECWQHFVLACRTLCTKSITIEKAKLGDALLLQFCRRTERLFGKDYITPNMHLHCHLYECITDYGPLHSFWCFAFERYNGILGSMPNNNRCIESQLMQRFLREAQSLSLSIPQDEFSQQLSPLLPKTRHTGSIADTMLTTTVHGSEDVQVLWTLDSITSFVDVPKFSSRCVLDSRQQDCAINLYSYLYSVSHSDIDIAHTCLSYSSVILNGKMFGTHKSRTAASSIIFGQWDSNLFQQPTAPSSGLRAARIEKFYKHSATINGEIKVHLLASLSWYKAHPQNQSFGKPVSVWYYDLFEYCGLVPVQFLVTRAISLVDELDGESVLFVVPCVE